MNRLVTVTPERLTEIQEVSDRAQAGDRAAVPRLRELMAEFPAMADYNGDLANQAAAVWIGLAAGDNLLLREAMSHKLAALREELTGGDPGPVLRLLVDRVILSWLSANYFAATEANALAARESPRLLAHRTKRRLQAERAHYAALGALVTMRKLSPPPSTPTPKALPLAADAGPGEITNRLSDYFAELARTPGTAAKRKTRAAN